MSQNGKTPGQAAYEAYDAHLGPIDDPGYVGPHDVPLTPWEDVRSPEREAWEAAAQAAITAREHEPVTVPEGQAIALRPRQSDTVVVAARTTIPEDARDHMRRAFAADGLSVVFTETVEAIADIPSDPVLREQLATALKRLDDLEDWTTMLIQRDEARALVDELRAILLQGGQDAGTVRRSALAALDRAGMIGDGK